MATQNSSKISWQAPEFRHYEKNAGWYVTLMAIGILIVGFFIIQKDIFAAISMAVITILIALFSRHKPKTVNIELSNKGVHFGNLFFPYKQIRHFWIVDNEQHKTLNFETTAYLNNLIILQLQDQDPDKIRNFLSQFLLEHESNEETFTQKVIHKLKF